jgi:hypothetical protein
LPDITREMKWRMLRWAEHVARIVEKRRAYRIVEGRHEVRSQLEGLKPR